MVESKYLSIRLHSSSLVCTADSSATDETDEPPPKPDRFAAESLLAGDSLREKVDRNDNKLLDQLTRTTSFNDSGGDSAAMDFLPEERALLDNTGIAEDILGTKAEEQIR